VRELVERAEGFGSLERPGRKPRQSQLRGNSARDEDLDRAEKLRWIVLVGLKAGSSEHGDVLRPQLCESEGRRRTSAITASAARSMTVVCTHVVT
jgi:hypothetical protein